MILCDAIYPCKKLSLSILVYTGHGIITQNAISGHTGLKNDPDWSIHKLLDPYPLWRSHARPICFEMSEYDIFRLEICLF
jgi:hypothetical protein